MHHFHEDLREAVEFGDNSRVLLSEAAVKDVRTHRQHGAMRPSRVATVWHEIVRARYGLRRSHIGEAAKTEPTPLLRRY